MRRRREAKTAPAAGDKTGGADAKGMDDGDPTNDGPGGDGRGSAG